MTPRIKYLEEEVRKLNLELCGIEDYVHGDFGDPLTVKSKDVEIFVGTLQDLERWMQGFKFARQREWVGLNFFDRTLLRTTYAPLKPIYHDKDNSVCAEVVRDWEAFFTAIEAKLREKNT